MIRLCVRAWSTTSWQAGLILWKNSGGMRISANWTMMAGLIFIISLNGITSSQVFDTGKLLITWKFIACWQFCWHLCCQRTDKLPAGTKTILSLSGTGKKGNRWLWRKWWIQKQKETHFQRRSGRQYILFVIISAKRQRKTCRKRLTGCWLQKQADRKYSWAKWLDWVNWNGNMSDSVIWFEWQKIF